MVLIPGIVTVDEMAEEFIDIYTECIIEAVPRKEIKKTNRRKKPPWWNEKVSVQAGAKKNFRRHRTPTNSEILKSKEAFDKVTDEAKVDWTQQVCDKDYLC